MSASRASTTFLLVHGNAGNWAVWDRVVAHIGVPPQAGRINLTGFGTAADAMGHPTIESCGWEHFVRSVVTTARLEGLPVVLAGNGFGSTLCGHAATGPNTVRPQSVARMRAPMCPPPARQS